MRWLKPSKEKARLRLGRCKRKAYYELATLKPNFSKLLHISQVISIASLTKA